MPPSPDARSSHSRPPRTHPSAGADVAPSSRRRGARPAVLWAVVGAVWAEALAVAAAAVVLVVVVVRGTQLAAASAALAVLAAGLALVLVAAGRALIRGRRWARSPVITVHVLVVAMSLASWKTAPAPWPVVGVALGLLVVVGLLLPAVVSWTGSTGSPGRPSPGGPGAEV